MGRMVVCTTLSTLAYASAPASAKEVLLLERSSAVAAPPNTPAAFPMSTLGSKPPESTSVASEEAWPPKPALALEASSERIAERAPTPFVSAGVNVCVVGAPTLVRSIERPAKASAGEPASRKRLGVPGTRMT